MTPRTDHFGSADSAAGQFHVNVQCRLETGAGQGHGLCVAEHGRVLLVLSDLSVSEEFALRQGASGSRQEPFRNCATPHYHVIIG
jgi:hypothetical protein